MLLDEYITKRRISDAEFSKAYDELEPEFQIAQQVIELRLQRGMSQAELARKVGTRQSGISRLESGEYTPSLSVVRRIADALEAKVEIRFRPTNRRPRSRRKKKALLKR